jgi:copper chaperone CopZ
MTINPDARTANMYCGDCPFVVRKSLEAVPGVSKVAVSYKDKDSPDDVRR